jgi:hypothetical protein
MADADLTSTTTSGRGAALTPSDASYAPARRVAGADPAAILRAA